MPRRSSGGEELEKFRFSYAYGIKPYSVVTEKIIGDPEFFRYLSGAGIEE
jgi:hypothetical protein